MSGIELMEQFKRSALELGAKFLSAKVMAITPGKVFDLTLSTGRRIRGQTLIVAGGRIPRRLQVLGEDKFFGRGVSICATCDGPLYKGKTVAVVGGGNAAVEAALELSSLAKTTYLIHRRDTFRADEISVQKLKVSPVQLLMHHQVVEVKGDDVIRAVVVQELVSGIRREIALHGIFLEIGSDVNAALVTPFRSNENNEIIVDVRQRTSVPGAFAAGDVTNAAFQQTVIAAGAGATAALEAHRFLTNPDYVWPAAT